MWLRTMKHLMRMAVWAKFEFSCFELRLATNLLQMFKNRLLGPVNRN
jgi:hypothetical protein